jgi:hypothetical protein
LHGRTPRWSENILAGIDFACNETEGQDDVSCGLHHSRKVGVGAFFRAAEERIEQNEARAAPRQIADQLGPDTARPGPASELIGERPEAGIIDIDDDDIAIAG